MTGLVRANVDTHEGHEGLDFRIEEDPENPGQTRTRSLEPFHRTYYAKGSPNVSVNNEPAIRKDDATLCGDVASEGSATVFINNKPVHRAGDSTSGHGGWQPNSASSGSNNVSAG